MLIKNHLLCGWNVRTLVSVYTKKPFCYIGGGYQPKPNRTEDIMMNNKANDTYSLSHTSWKCQYHIVFAPKYRRLEIYGKLKTDIGAILRKLCEQKNVNIIEAQACPDHIHMLVEISPSVSVSQFMGFLKGKSSLMIFDRHANL